ncbi:hypothetical protein HJFPF1_04141 [Paramyrothecium foliicola]|nr:hypothetical protein HJFPF1_04141 [Paramyrothecium foliicola]
MYLSPAIASTALVALNLIAQGVASPTAKFNLEPRAKCADSFTCSGGVQRTQCVGKHDGAPGFWVCVDACWYSEYKVKARLKVHDSSSSTAQISGWFEVGGAGVSQLQPDVYNDGPLGHDECSGLNGKVFDHPFGNTKRILTITFNGSRYRGEGSETAVMKNPKVA